MPSTLLGTTGRTAPAVTTMPTANPPTETRISSLALDVLGCYVETFDRVIYQIAEDFAKERQAEFVTLGKPVRIEVEDVKRAAELFTSSVRQQFGGSAEHHEFLHAVEGMHECLKKRCQNQVETSQK